MCLINRLLIVALGIRCTYAFDDDICFHDGAWDNCYARDTLGPKKSIGCGPTQVDDKNPGACGRWVKKMYFTLPKLQGRSTFHSDATFLLAQLIGFKADFAFWMTAYTEGVDKGKFRPLHRNGSVSVEQMHPADLTGFNRFHYCAGASEFHYVVRSSPPTASANTLSPPLAQRLGHATYADGDAQILQTRKWAFSDGATPLCVNGLTAPTEMQDANAAQEVPVDPRYYSGKTCYCGGNFEVHHIDKKHCVSQAVKWRPSFLGLMKWNLITRNGDQPLTFDHTEASNHGFSPTDLAKYYMRGKKCKPQELQGLVWADGMTDHLSSGKATGRFRGGPVPAEVARFGIYLHQLQDAYSHRTCYDNSYMKGPDKDGNFQIGYNTTKGYCDTPAHVLHHYWELGFPMHWPTTPAALLGTLLEIRRFSDSVGASHPGWLSDAGADFSEAAILSALSFSVANPEWATSTPSATTPKVLQVLSAILGALSTPTGIGRIRALEDVADKLALVKWESALDGKFDASDGPTYVSV